MLPTDTLVPPVSAAQYAANARAAIRYIEQSMIESPEFTELVAGATGAMAGEFIKCILGQDGKPTLLDVLEFLSRITGKTFPFTTYYSL